MVTLTYPKDFNDWRKLARGLLAEGISPTDLLWEARADGSLFGESFTPQKSTQLVVPKGFIDLARTAAAHRSDEQWSLLYSLLWRLTHGEKHLLSLSTDPELHRIKAMVKHISRDIHKMHAFVRFRKVSEHENSGREQFISWFEPQHRIIRLTSGFFRNRFAGMNWSILTPDECMHWDGQKITFTEGVDQSQAPDEDALDELWRGYYRSIFNPARLKVKAMQSEMPKKYWKNLPEAEIIEELISTSSQRTDQMLTTPASPLKPAPQNAYLEKLKTLPNQDLS
ncbi:MAG: TIGR03915 family putative DNA repair protein [Akkermansiaceae bacterium]